MKILILTVSIILISGSCKGNKSANEQCLEKVLPGKTLNDVTWGKLQTEAFVKDNKQYQCFILCGLSNLNILKENGAVEINGNPLKSELDDVIANCAKEPALGDSCKTAKQSALCLLKSAGTLNPNNGVGKIIKDKNAEFKNSGKTIKWH
uniref:D7-related salivary protein n=1 Tax=Culicoides nubeculosus TaxID=144565 RepID=B9URM1_CULNU|nr:D7-related salivary protein [Culicoides nubeculosus]